MLRQIDAGVAPFVKASVARFCFRFFEPLMNEAAMRRMELEQGLHRAIEQEEFVLFYQPKYNVQSGRMIGVEALIRWNHPSFGIVPPSEFIPLAEETRLILPLGEWILRTACAQNKAWQQAGYPPIKVAVNLSMLQIREDYLVPLLARTLEETGLDSRFLELEIRGARVLF
ncbi:EAL domain-containing protein [Paenibacillus hodogayensis]|uniref:EAL domain-containing protein n=1 Tax=Paenibacillus hodogayensis TaxID=279208 RepID=A0ABV5VYV8_9BACL